MVYHADLFVMMNDFCKQLLPNLVQLVMVVADLLLSDYPIHTILPEVFKKRNFHEKKFKIFEQFSEIKYKHLRNDQHQHYL